MIDSFTLCQFRDDALPFFRWSIEIDAYPFVPTSSDCPTSYRRRIIRQNSPHCSEQARVTGFGEFLGLQQVRYFSSNFKCLFLTFWFFFPRHILKTNFYQPTKVALSFRLAPDFLPEVEYPRKPFGMFFVIGTHVCLIAASSTWTENNPQETILEVSTSASGMLHVVVFVSSCREIGSMCDYLLNAYNCWLRTLCSRNYSINQRMLFDENYNLASTQSLKNKDIPEGGAKGTILPSSVVLLCFFLRFSVSDSWTVGLEPTQGVASKNMSM